MLDSILSMQPWLMAVVIFFLRVADMSLDTLRVLVVMRGRKSVAWILGFFQAAIFVLAITSVLKDLDNLLNVFGYAAGFATGVVLGMWIEGRLAIGYTHLRVISPRRGAALAEQLRQAGYAVTEVSGQGKDGMVSLLNCSVLRRKAPGAINLVEQIDPEAFVTAEAVRAVRRGFWGG